MMKNAYERALERFGSAPVRKLSDEQKARIADIDRICQARLAEADLKNQERMAKAAGNAEELAQIRQDYSVETASIRDRAERDKDAIRGAG